MMKHFNNIEVKDTADVLAFFVDLHENGINFNPDDSFADMVELGGSGRPSFDPKTAKQLDEIMDKCHTVCQEQEQDIYLIAMDVKGFLKFFATHRKITDRAEMDAFANEYEGEGSAAEEGIKAYHIFNGTYAIHEYNDEFAIEMDSLVFSGTLKEVAIKVYNWMDKDLPEGYLDQVK